MTASQQLLAMAPEQEVKRWVRFRAGVRVSWCMQGMKHLKGVNASYLRRTLVFCVRIPQRKVM
jgi:hypothetical protein